MNLYRSNRMIISAIHWYYQFLLACLIIKISTWDSYFYMFNRPSNRTIKIYITQSIWSGNEMNIDVKILIFKHFVKKSYFTQTLRQFSCLRIQIHPFMGSSKMIHSADNDHRKLIEMKNTKVWQVWKWNCMDFWNFRSDEFLDF